MSAPAAWLAFTFELFKTPNSKTSTQKTVGSRPQLDKEEIQRGKQLTVGNIANCQLVYKYWNSDMLNLFIDLIFINISK